MTTFFDSLHCTSKVHCRTCRDKEGGKKWRESLLKVFEDVKKVDFNCPAGLPWGAPRQIPVKVKKRVRFKASGKVEINGKECVGCGNKKEEK